MNLKPAGCGEHIVDRRLKPQRPDVHRGEDLFTALLPFDFFLDWAAGKCADALKLSRLSFMEIPYALAVLRTQAEPPERWMVAAVVTTVLAAKSNGKSET